MLVYETLHAAKEKLVASSITGIGRGNVLIAAVDEPIGRLLHRYIELTKASDDFIRAFAGGAYIRYWFMKVYIHSRIFLNQIYSSRRETEELCKLGREVIKTFNFWYQTPLAYLAGTGLVDAIDLTTTHGGIGYLFSDPVQYIGEVGPAQQTIAGRNEYMLEQTYRIVGRLETHADFDL